MANYKHIVTTEQKPQQQEIKNPAAADNVVTRAEFDALKVLVKRLADHIGVN